MKKIYISGPISGLDKEVYEKNFSDAKEFLIKLNGELHVISPIEITSHLSPVIHDWKQYMIPCIEALLDCESIYMLNNWRNSRGARLEHSIAKSLNLNIGYQNKNEIDFKPF